jgi:DNA-binding CsgD family transcriptional regulator
MAIASPDELAVGRHASPVLIAADRLWNPAPVPAQRNRSERSRALIGLTRRELQVLQCVADGLTAGATGRSLGISESTVRKHLQNCYRKLDRTDRLGAVLLAQRLGIISVG